MMLIRCLLSAILTTSLISAQDTWLEFNAGAPESSSPLVQFNGRWDSFLTFDVELRGLLAETLTVDSLDYLRFSTSPGTVPSDSVGWPELPVVRRMVWLPDDSDIELEYSASCCEGIECLPVYPVPLDSLVQDSTCTPFIGEYFRLDSAAYASEEWYPEDQAELVGEFRLRDLRVGIVDVYPVQYLASEGSLRAWSDIEVTLSWDEGNAVWSEAGLGHFDNLIGDNLLGYTPEPQPLNDSDGSVVRLDWDELEEGPGYAPDYVILVAAGLDGQAVTDLADHRDDLNGFDVAIVRTDDLLTFYGGTQTILTAEMIRDFTEDMWEWGRGPGDRPTYLLLIGDHEDPAYASEAWFLPTHLAPQGDPCWYWANDSWFVLFGENRSALSAWPDMIVGRLPARTTAELVSMVDRIEDFEEPVTSWPPPQSIAWRRYLTRLSGQNKKGPYTPYDPWVPTDEWASAFADWLGYGYDNLNCGDGDDETNRDGSDVTAHEWVDTLIEWFERGQQVVFYVNHGETHMYSAGIQWLPDPPLIVVPPNMGVPDSVFDSFEVADLGAGMNDHVHPFVLSICCLNGTFNHTVAQHEYSDGSGGHYECMHFDPLHYPPLWDYGTDCLAETWMKNTASGAIGVFASSEVSQTGLYGFMGMNLLRSIYCQGMSRTGDAVASMRLMMLDQYNGGCNTEMGRFNLLGDPAVDMGDRVKFPGRCDLVISPPELRANRYPTRSIDGEGTVGFQAVVHNFGGTSSRRFPVELEVQWGQQSETLTAACAGLQPGESETLRFEWELPHGFTVPTTVSLRAVADPEGDCTDSWTANNDASMTFELVDLYPNDEGFPIKVPGSINSPPLLADLDGDEDLEVVVIVGNWFMSAYDPDEPIWTVGPYRFNAVSSAGGYTVPLAANIMTSTGPEIVVDTVTELLVISATGNVLCSYSHTDPTYLLSAHPHTPVVADIISDNNTKEIGLLTASGSGSTRQVSLLILELSGSNLSLADSLPLPESGLSYLGGWLSSENLLSDSSDEILVSYTWATAGPNRQSGLWICDYNPRTDACFFADSIRWANESISRYSIPAVGELAGSMRIAVSRQRNTSHLSPAYILDAGLGLVDSCEQNQSLASNQVLCCMMADWVTGAGAERIISPSENQTFAWRDSGQVLSGWPRPFDSYDTFRPPFPALGELDNEDEYSFSNLVVATRSGWVTAYESGGEILADLGFPYQMPAEARGGICIADIDGDEQVEMVFGTADGYLQVWQLGSCDELYSPWPQCQHDAARTGVLP